MDFKLILGVLAKARKIKIAVEFRLPSNRGMEKKKVNYSNIEEFLIIEDWKRKEELLYYLDVGV